MWTTLRRCCWPGPTARPATPPRTARAAQFPLDPRAAASPPLAAAFADATLAELKKQAKQDPAVRFGLHVSHHPCKVVKVYDGDSVTLAWPRAGWEADREGPSLAAARLCYANCRLFGIDTPELRGTTGEERARAEACRDAMRDLAMDQLFVFTTVGDTGLDKYGRPLVILHARPGFSSQALCRALGRDSLNDWALRTLPGCKAYFGGTKETAEANGNA